MPHIIAQDASVIFEMYDPQSRSLRHSFLRAGATSAIKPNQRLGGHISYTYGRRISVEALNKLNFSILDGDRVGLIGHNGAGKTTLLRMMAGIYEPVSGVVSIDGAVTALFNTSEGADPDATGMEVIRLRAALNGLSAQQTAAFIEDICTFAELGEFINLPIRIYSSGMLVRLTFAMATANRPDILLMDEAIGAGDSAFIEKAQARLQSFIKSTNILVVATHNVEILRQWCNKGMLLQKGGVVEMGDVEAVIARYHELTMATE